jgi:hypothetical protein
VSMQSLFEDAPLRCTFMASILRPIPRRHRGYHPGLSKPDPLICCFILGTPGLLAAVLQPPSPLPAG